jgi:acyl transferase domain-containing protein
MSSSWIRAKSQMDKVHFLEAHGSGSNAGDVAEFQALDRVFGQHPVLLSSVKTSVGHTEAASGLVALLRVASLFQLNMLSPHLHFRQLNPKLETASKLVIPVESVALSKEFCNVSLSNRGFSGTNVHAMVKRCKCG